MKISFDSCLGNKVDRLLRGHACFAGIIGGQPSRYSRSPALWTAAFKSLGIKAVYVPFDVSQASRLKLLLEKLSQDPRCLGVNVTVPYKTKVIPFVKELGGAIDPQVERIVAANTLVRNSKGRWMAYNTDEAGAINSLERTLPNQERPFIQSLSGLTVLLLGAGGAARAIAFAISSAIGASGRLFIYNRTRKRASELSGSVNRGSGHCLVPNRPNDALRLADLLINATPSIPLEAFPHWETNLKDDAKLFDVVYDPPETAFLRQGRLSGHPTLNGKGMLIWQAVDSFLEVMQNRIPHEKNVRKKILQAMTAAMNKR